MQSRVARVEFKFEEGPKIRQELRNCVLVLSKLIQVVEETEQDAGWSQVFDPAANAQRNYIWSIDKMQKMDLGDETEILLQNLTLDISTS